MANECKLEKKPVEKKEMVNHPVHYGGDTTYECIKVLKAWLSKDEYKGFLKGNAIKYLCRTGKKDEIVQELNKAKWYLERLIEEEKCEFAEELVSSIASVMIPIKS